MENSLVYVSPDVEVIEYETEGVLCISGVVDDSDDVEFF